MPLFVTDEFILQNFSGNTAKAILMIKEELSDRRVTPTMALSLIRRHLIPLLPDEHKDALALRKNTSWDDLRVRFAELAFRQRASDGVVVDVAKTINLVIEHSTDPPRQTKFHNSIETTYFIQMSRTLGTDVEALRYVNGIDIFRFCRFCWRQPVSGRALCWVHNSSGKLVSGEKSGDVFTESGYKQGQRQLKLYDQVLNDMLTSEVSWFHDSYYRAPVLIPGHGLAEWVEKRRPRIWDSLAVPSDSTWSDETFVDFLLSKINDVPITSPSVKKAIEVINNQLRAQYYLLWPMLLRAEAWLITRTSKKNNWGGKR